MLNSIQSKKLYLYLAIVDLGVLLFSFFIAYTLRFNRLQMDSFREIIWDSKVLAVLVLVIVFNFIFDLYEVKYWINSIFSPLRIVMSSVCVALAMSLWIYIFAAESTDVIGRGVFLGALGGYLVFSLFFRWLFQFMSRQKVGRSHWLIVGGEGYRLEFEKECTLSGFSLNVTWLDPDSDDVEKLFRKGLGSSNLNGVVICDKVKPPLAKLLMEAKFAGHKIYDFQFFFERVWGKVAVKFLGPNWFIFGNGFSIVHERAMSRIKTILDFLGALTLLLISFPLILLSCILICLDSRGMPFYKQKRVGLNGKVFTIFKLRSMAVNAEANGAQWAKKEDSRVTRVGRFMRLTRIDELPQLINVLKGEMSFVGPRPERPEFTQVLEKEIPYYNLRHLVKPGLTGWAQVIFSYAADKEDSLQKLQYELFYIKNQSIWLDFIIVFKTFVVVLFGKGR